MAKSPPEMSPAEFNVMKVLWRLNKASVAEVRCEHAQTYGSDLAYTTVMTLLSRLATKGAVKVDKKRQPFIYKPAFRRETVLRERLRQFVDTVFDGAADSLVLHLVEDESLSIDELRGIEAKIGDAPDDPDTPNTEEGGK